MKKGKFNIIIGGQAGSEAKGKLSGWLCDKHQPDAVVMTSSPNAGHTIVKDDGSKHVSYHLPIGAIMCQGYILLTAASLINPVVLRNEIYNLGIEPSRIIIDPRASIIAPGHLYNESNTSLSDIGSTLQGVGACRMGKMKRNGSHPFVSDYPGEFLSMGVQISCGPVAELIDIHLSQNNMVLCETTQGFDLDLEHGIDRRYCTSKMINPSMAAAEAGVAPSMVGDVYGVLRPYPIRVNNRTGTSGPYANAAEITWQTVADRCGVPPTIELGEITTTTKLPRRVFEFSWGRYAIFLRTCKPTHLCLQFANYIDWSVYEATKHESLTEPVVGFMNLLEETQDSPYVSFVGTGPKHSHMINLEVS